MGCLVIIVALMLPRLAMALIYFFTPWFEKVFTVWLWPVLGFFFAPYTTLAYMGAILNAGTVTTPWLIIIIVAALVDVGHWGGGYRARRRK